MSPSRLPGSRERDWENGSNASSPASVPEYTGERGLWVMWGATGALPHGPCSFLLSPAAPLPHSLGPRLYKEPSAKSNKFIIHNALSHCCLAGKVNEPQKNRILEVSPPTRGSWGLVGG